MAVIRLDNTHAKVVVSTCATVHRKLYVSKPPASEGRRYFRLVDLQPGRKTVATLQRKGQQVTPTTTRVRDQSKFRVSTTRLVKSSKPLPTKKKSPIRTAAATTTTMGAEKHEFPKEIVICHRPQRQERPLTVRHNHHNQNALPPLHRVDRSVRHQQLKSLCKMTTVATHDPLSDGSDSCFSQSSALFELELETPERYKKHFPDKTSRRRNHHHRTQALTQDGFEAILSQMPDLLLKDRARD